MRIVFLGIAAMVSCIEVKSEVVVCDADWTCPPETECNEQFHLCVSQAQRAACDGKADLEPCELTAANEVCFSGICIPDVCGDSVLSPAERCDDGNLLSFDGCSATCDSDETCGNGIVDLSIGEDCDDGNQLDSDGCSSSCGLEAAEWTRRPTSVPPRMAAKVAYDSARDRVVLLGGVAPVVTPNGAAATTLDDVWEWDGRWRDKGVVTPLVTEGSAMTYDTKRKRLVLLAPRLGANTALTWEHDGKQWTLASSDGPNVFTSAMAYDPVADRTIVVGGQKVLDFVANYTAEQWAWDGSSWSMLSTPSSGTIATPRAGAQLVFDPKRGSLLLFGGNTQAGLFFNDLWERVGTSWQQRTADGATGANVPTRRTNAAMAWNTSCQCTVMFGGQTGASTVDNSTYTWSGTAWSKVSSTANPPSSSYGALVSDGHGHNVLFGGTKTGTKSNDPTTYVADTWIFDGTSWRVESPRLGSVVAFDTRRHRVVMFGGIPIVAGGQDDTFELTEHGWILRATTIGTSAPLEKAAMAYDEVRHETVLAGGTRSSTTLDPSTWIWDGSAWTARTVATQMTPENDRVMIFDPDHAEVVAFGGSHPNPSNTSMTVYANETWTWNGTTWTNENPAQSPSPRDRAAAAYDRANHQLVLFGGFTAAGWSVETWIWDGTTWTVKTGAAPTSLVPNQPKMSWDPARRKVVLFTSDALQAWEWDAAAGQWLAVATSQGVDLLRGSVVYPGFDGAGIDLAGGNYNISDVQGPSWELRWSGSAPHDDCRIGTDDDGDGRAGCEDPDCWAICTPSCAPGDPCDTAAPRCGDATCDGFETCRSCATDCACGNVCGDGMCDAGETCPGDCP